MEGSPGYEQALGSLQRKQCHGFWLAMRQMRSWKSATCRRSEAIEVPCLWNRHGVAKFSHNVRFSVLVEEGECRMCPVVTFSSCFNLEFAVICCSTGHSAALGLAQRPGVVSPGATWASSMPVN